MDRVIFYWRGPIFHYSPFDPGDYIDANHYRNRVFYKNHPAPNYKIIEIGLISQKTEKKRCFYCLFKIFYCN